MYELKITTKLQKWLKRCGNEGLKKKLERLLKNPKSYGKPLSENLQGTWSARCDPFRILYEIDDEAKQLIVVRIETRDDVYE